MSISMSTLSLNMPAGSILSYAGSSVPTGFLAANGSAVSRATYSALYSAIGTTYGAGDGSTTFNLPDLRGVFLRGVDAGRGLDSGRTLGTYQADAYASHNHGINDAGHSHSVNDPGHSHNFYWDISYGTNNMPFSASNGISAFKQAPTTGSTTGIGINTNTTGITVQASGSTETRAKNVAITYIIKY